MDKQTRGFKHLRGVTISGVNATCVNEVALFSADNDFYYVIQAEMGESGIPVISLVKRKQTWVPLPGPVRPYIKKD